MKGHLQAILIGSTLQTHADEAKYLEPLPLLSKSCNLSSSADTKTLDSSTAQLSRFQQGNEEEGGAALMKYIVLYSVFSGILILG